MDLLQLLTGSENLYKYLFLGGIGLVIVSLFYPLNKRFELAKQKDLINKNIGIQNHKIEKLQEEVKSANAQYDLFQHEIDSLKNDAARNGVKISSIKDGANKTYSEVLKQQEEMDLGHINIHYDSARIETLNNHIEDFEGYQNSFIWIGSILGAVGIFGWFRLMRAAHGLPASKKQSE